MDSGNYEIVARFEGVKAKKARNPGKPSPNRLDRPLVSRINKVLGELTVNRYERVVPFQTIFTLLERSGFEPTENSQEAAHGNEGRTTIEFVHPDYPYRLYYLHMTWYQMPSTNFETVARLESTWRR